MSSGIGCPRTLEGLTDETVTASGIEALRAERVRTLVGEGACSDGHHRVC